MIEFKTWSDIPEYFTGIYKITDTGNIYHMKDGKFHNESGPAIICQDGSKIWYIDGLAHRENGPAFEYADGVKEWFYKDQYYGSGDEFTSESWKKKVKELKRKEELSIFK